MKALSLALCLCGLVWAHCAGAQTKPNGDANSAAQDDSEIVPPEQARVLLKDFARCAYRSNPTVAKQYVAASDTRSLDHFSMRNVDLAKSMDFEECLGEQARPNDEQMIARLPKMVIRALLVEEAYLAANPKPPVLAQGATETTTRHFVSVNNILVRAQSDAAFADCIVFHDLALADALVRTLPGSKTESNTARALAPTLGRCLPAGQTMAFSPANIRVFVADGLWARFVAAGLVQ